MAMIEFVAHQFQLYKLIVHLTQVVLFSVAWCLCIAIFRSTADVDGRLGWYFGLVGFTLLPAHQNGPLMLL
jgi:uncharacterized membrane protein YagU involved in acid resistance